MGRDKTRLVFDANGKSLPGFQIVPKANDLVISWGGAQNKTSVPAAAAAPNVVPAAVQP